MHTSSCSVQGLDTEPYGSSSSQWCCSQAQILTTSTVNFTPNGHQNSTSTHRTYQTYIQIVTLLNIAHVHGRTNRATKPCTLFICKVLAQRSMQQTRQPEVGCAAVRRSQHTQGTKKARLQYNMAAAPFARCVHAESHPVPQVITQAMRPTQLMSYFAIAILPHTHPRAMCTLHRHHQRCNSTHAHCSG